MHTVTVPKDVLTIKKSSKYIVANAKELQRPQETEKEPLTMTSIVRNEILQNIFKVHMAVHTYVCRLVGI